MWFFHTCALLILFFHALFVFSFARTIVIKYNGLFTICLTAFAGKLDLIKYGDCSRNVQKTDSMAFITTVGQSLQSESSNLLTRQHFSRKYSEVSNLSPGLRSLGDVRHYQHQNLDFQQNLEHSVQPRVLYGKTYMAQPNSYFVNQDDICRQILGQKTLNQPQLSSLGLGGSATMNSRSSSQVLVEESILLEYFKLKEFNIVSRDDVVKYLHSTVCSEGICNCAKNIDLLMHFDVCQGDNCYICYSWKSRALESHLEIPNSLIMDSVVRKNKAPSGDSDAMLLPPNRRKMELAFGVSLINNANSDQLTHKMVQPCPPEPLPKRRKVESDFGVSLINNASLDQFTRKMQPSYPEALSELQQEQESLPSSEVTECNVELCTNPMLDLMSNSETKNNVVDGTFRQILKNETVLSKGSEADHISGEPDSKSHDEEASRNSEETAIGLNSIVDNTPCKESMAVDLEEPDSKSNEVKANSNFTETGVILNSYMNTLCKEPMAADIEEPDCKSDDVKANSNFLETGIILNSDMNTLCEEPARANIEDIQGRTGFNHDVKDATKKVIEPKADQEKETKSPNQTVNTVSLTDFFSSNQIREHITSLRKQFNQVSTPSSSVFHYVP